MPQANLDPLTDTHSKFFILNSTGIAQVCAFIIVLSGTILVVSGNDAHLLTDRSATSKIISDLLANEEYETALQIADSVKSSDPDNPFGVLLIATVLNSRAIDFEDGEDDIKLEQACNEVENLSLIYFTDKDSSLVYRFYMGTIEMYRMMVQVKRGSYFKAFKGIRRAGKLFDEAVKIDSTFWDAYYGSGVFTYYRSSRAGILRTLHLVSDDRMRGISYIQEAADKGTITALAAQNTLAWIAIEREDYEKSLAISSRLNRKYPDTRAFLWCKGNALRKMERWEEVIIVYNELLKSVQSEQRNNYFNQLGCLHSIAQANTGLENWAEVVENVNQAFALNLNSNVAKRKKADLNRLKKMKTEAIANLENN